MIKLELLIILYQFQPLPQSMLVIGEFIDMEIIKINFPNKTKTEELLEYLDKKLKSCCSNYLFSSSLPSTEGETQNTESHESVYDYYSRYYEENGQYDV